MMRRRLTSVRRPETKVLVPLMAYEHVKQCLQVAESRVRADAAIILAEDRFEQERRRALTFVKGARR